MRVKTTSPERRPEISFRQAPAIQVREIDHVTLVVRDLEQSRRFYVDVLGMREVPRPAFACAGAWFQAGTTQIHVIREFPGSGPAGNLLSAPLRSSCTPHVAFAVADAAAVAARLAKCQIPILSGPQPRPDGYVQVYLTDPDGHVIELCSPSPRCHSGAIRDIPDCF